MTDNRLNLWQRLRRRLRGWTHRAELDRELQEEISSHLAEAEEELVRRGHSPEEARRAARRGFGGVTRARDQYREALSLPMVDQISRDCRQAWRSLVRTPASSLVILLFVRPKRKFLEVCLFLGRPLKSALVHRVDSASKSKIVHTLRITHRDQVEPPFTEWLQEAYELPDKLAATRASKPKARSAKRIKKADTPRRLAARARGAGVGPRAPK